MVDIKIQMMLNQGDVNRMRVPIHLQNKAPNGATFVELKVSINNENNSLMFNSNADMNFFIDQILTQPKWNKVTN